MKTKKGEGRGTPKKKMSKKELTRFIDLIRDGDNFEKEKAINALIASPSKEAVEGIIPLLQQKNTVTRMAVLDVLKKIGSVSLESVLGMLDDENEDIRVYGCEVLSFLKDRRAVPSLIRSLHEEDDNVRNAACMALGDFDDDEAVAALVEALKDVEWIAFSAIYSIGRTKSRSAIPQLVEFFKTSGEELSIAACEVLLEYGDDEILNEIFETLKGWDRQKRNTYLKIILEKGNEEIFEKLKEKIGDELNEHLLNSVRYEKQYSLEVIRMLTHFRQAETCEAILDVLSGMERDGDEFGSILELFVSMSDVWADSISDYMKRDEKYLFPLVKACKIAGIKLEEPLLLDIFLSSPADVKREIVTGVPGLSVGNGASIIREAIKDTDGHIKGSAVDVVGALSLKELKNEIIDIAQRGFADVRTKALKALLSLDTGRAMDLIKTFVYDGSNEDKRTYLSATSLIDSEKNFPFIEKLASDADEGVRRAAIGILGNFLDNGHYLTLLKTILMDENIPHEVLKVIKDKKLSMFKDRLVEVFADAAKGLWTRYYALSALGAFEDGSLFDVFANGLKDENGLITIGCIRALADLDDRKAIEYIRPFATSSNEDVKSNAESVLQRLEGN
ncbi:MAG TPA: HEAT repeat domain-containing protein [Syntrophorhabdaceae bacterium]|nr:HEAT repeat domain-containing protein [Syntrophorhabdaceae bacterium]